MNRGENITSTFSGQLSFHFNILLKKVHFIHYNLFIIIQNKILRKAVTEINEKDLYI